MKYTFFFFENIRVSESLKEIVILSFDTHNSNDSDISMRYIYDRGFWYK